MRQLVYHSLLDDSAPLMQNTYACSSMQNAKQQQDTPHSLTTLHLLGKAANPHTIGTPTHPHLFVISFTTAQLIYEYASRR